MNIFIKKKLENSRIHFLLSYYEDLRIIIENYGETKIRYTIQIQHAQISGIN